ncbi:E3 ubiquitin-protein ligase ORTHRUS 2-like [Neltuma alba]|uniref:E3 ubiquitin-protein ligase ORTHRUS 2-like n=1 Tax=Neltuma alba TaxID=207710 RepID=UPI0010A42A4D|nr:E3 ubiquitin-protein ligase ORTHRUS 2-like [Prosopis alba]
MAHVTQLPCDCDGVCMICKAMPADEEKLTCKTCLTQWHVSCLSNPLATMAEAVQWECPDCSTPPSDIPPMTIGKAVVDGSGDLMAAIRAIEADASLMEREKAKKRQKLLSGKAASEDDEGGLEKAEGQGNDVLDILSGTLNCSFCMLLPERPVTTPCGHNFCLKCFQKWIGQGKLTCAKCRSNIPSKMASQPRINSALVIAIRMAKVSNNIGSGEISKAYHFVHNQDRPEKAYTTERARRNGKANAASGKIFVTVPQDHFGPIPAENDPVRNQGVLVGACWEDRLECRQWGVHFPHVSGIAGQSNYGAQSVVLSGGYVDDEDHGEYFLYTGSGGRDLSGNRRTNRVQSFDQKFDKSNLALEVSCLKGYPVRVVRSHKDKHSSYAPEKGLRYDGVYRIEKCWQKLGLQGFKVCRYLFVRCDNEPAPWTSDCHGDRPRHLPEISEMEKAIGIIERKENPSWDFDEEESCWKWKKPPPRSQRPVKNMNPGEGKRSRRETRKTQNMSIGERLLKEFGCPICNQVMVSPVTTPCAHNFCKSCLEGAFAGQSFVTDRSRGGRSLRSRKNVMKCPSCPTDIADFLQNLQVNTELKGVIESLKAEAEENGDSVEPSEDADGAEEACDDTGSASAGDEEEETSVEKHKDLVGGSDAQQIQSKELEVNEKADAGGNGSGKRKRDDAEEVSMKRNRRSCNAEVERNGSPSSPLHLPSDY